MNPKLRSIRNNFLIWRIISDELEFGLLLISEYFITKEKEESKNYFQISLSRYLVNFQMSKEETSNITVLWDIITIYLCTCFLRFVMLNSLILINLLIEIGFGDWNYFDFFGSSKLFWSVTHYSILLHFK